MSDKEEVTIKPEDVGELETLVEGEPGKDGSYEIVSTDKVLGLVPSEKGDGSYDLTMVAPTEVTEPKKKRKPWKVGVTDQGEDVYAPVAGPNANKVLHLKFDVGVCRGCRCTVHKRSAAVDPWGNVWCRNCWPYGSFKDPRYPKENPLEAAKKPPELADLGKAPRLPGKKNAE